MEQLTEKENWTNRQAAANGVSRASLYKSLAEGGKLRFDTISKVIKALDCKLTIEDAAAH